MPRIEVVLSNASPVLEGCLDLPDAPGTFPGVVLCHPHPLYGGNMKNNVIVAVSRALVKEGIACLRFNFRGVGRSQGSFADGIGEQDDALAALSFISARKEIDASRVGIAGYSFGGMVALSIGDRSDIVRAIAVVSPVIPAGALRECTKPKLIICGTEDDMTPLQEVLDGVARMSEPKVMEVVEGADHFWWGYEEKVAGFVAGFFKERLNNGGSASK